MTHINVTSGCPSVLSVNELKYPLKNKQCCCYGSCALLTGRTWLREPRRSPADNMTRHVTIRDSAEMCCDCSGLPRSDGRGLWGSKFTVHPVLWRVGTVLQLTVVPAAASNRLVSSCQPGASDPEVIDLRSNIFNLRGKKIWLRSVVFYTFSLVPCS